MIFQTVLEMFCMVLMTLMCANYCTGSVYVNGEKGSDVDGCGSTRELACKTLDKAVVQVSDSGTVYLDGNLKIDKTIQLEKSINISSVSDTPIVITAEKSQRVFTVKKNLKISFKSLELHDIGLLQIEKTAFASFVISKCRFIWSKPMKNLDDEEYSRNRKIHVSYCLIENSYFLNAAESVSVAAHSFVIKNTVFNNTGALTHSAIVTGIITNSIFHDTMLSIDGASLSITSCMFSGTEGLTFTGGKISISDSRLVGTHKFEEDDYNHCASLCLPDFSTVLISRLMISNAKTNVPVATIYIGNSKNVMISDIHCDNINRCVSLFESVSIVRRSYFQNHNGIQGGALQAQCRDNAGSVIIENCTFFNNSAREGGALYIQRTNATIRDCKFISNSASATGGSIHGQSKKGKQFKIEITNSSFTHSISDGRGGGIFAKGFSLEISSSTFEQNSAISDGSAIKTENSTKIKLSIIIRNSVFAYCGVPAIHIPSHTIEITNSTLIANDVSASTHIYLKANQIFIRYLNTEVKYPKLAKSNTKLNVLTAISTSMSSMKVDGGIDVTCGPNFNAEVTQSVISKESNDSKFLKIACKSCPHNMFTSSKKIHYKGYSVTQSCQHCPSGAICDGYVRSLDRFWGKDIGGKLVFLPCPSGYCCSASSAPCTSYNTCTKGRTGVLCGTCDDGYFQSYMTDACIPTGEQGCNMVAFIFYFILASMTYSIIFSVLPTIIEYTKKRIGRSKRKQADDGSIELTNEGKEEQEPLPITAFVTLAIFFYQIASFIHVDTQSHDVQITENVRAQTILFDTVNFRMTFYQGVCPLDDLTFVTKLFVDLALKMSTVVNLLWFLIIWESFNSIKFHLIRRNKSSAPIVAHTANQEEVYVTNSCLFPKTESQPDKLRSTLADCTEFSFKSQIKLGLIRLLKVNFTAIASILFRLIHCERIGEEVILYRYGTQQCYTWWQYLIFTTLIPILVTFPISFGILLDMLKERSISTKMFTASCVMPIITIWLCIKRKSGQLQAHVFEEEEERCVNEILQMEETLFKCEKGVRWPIVQLYRNLLAVLVNTFVLNPMFKTLWFSTLFIAYFIHDVQRKPFKHPYLNFLQIFTSASLFVVNLCNNPLSFSAIGDIKAVPDMSTYLLVLHHFEKGLYALVPLSLPIWKLFGYYQSKVKRINKK